MTQTILIAGTSRGIGLEMAKQARARGDKVIAMVDSKSLEMTSVDKENVFVVNES